MKMYVTMCQSGSFEQTNTLTHPDSPPHTNKESLSKLCVKSGTCVFMGYTWKRRNINFPIWLIILGHFHSYLAVIIKQKSENPYPVGDIFSERMCF